MSNPDLTKKAREQLARTLGMLGSAFDGEVAAAARSAEKIRIKARLSWAEILQPDAHQLDVAVAAARQLLDENARLQQQVNSLRAVIRDPDRLISQWSTQLNEWERQFMRSIHGRRRLSWKQQAKPRDILAKLDPDEMGEIE